MQTGFNSSLTPIDRSRALLVVGILAATFAVGLATGFLLSRVNTGAGQASGVVIVDTPRTTTKLDSWLLGVPAVAAAPAVTDTIISSWIDIPARAAAPAVSNQMISSWIDIPARAAAPAVSNQMIDSWRLAER